MDLCVYIYIEILSRSIFENIYSEVRAFVTCSLHGLRAPGELVMWRDAKDGFLAVHVDVVKQPQGP